MEFVLVGISHKTCPVELRETFSIDEKRKRALLKNFLSGSLNASELVWLSTCNRVDVYAVCNDGCGGDSLRAIFTGRDAGAGTNGVIYQKTGKDALRQLLNTAAGLDSMVIGESEILAQVKAAYAASQCAGTTGRITNLFFQKALGVGKLVRAETQIGRGGRSVASVAAQLAQRIFGDMSGARVLLIGAGEMAEEAAAGFAAKNARLTVINRTYPRAREIADRFSAECLGWEDMRRALESADVVLASTSSPEPIITKEMMKEAASARHGRPVFLVDISVPRNIQPEAGHLANVYRYDIDDLRRIVDENLASLSGEIKKAGEIVCAKTEEIWSEFADEVRIDAASPGAPLALGTRGSRLALAQAGLVRERLLKEGVEAENKIIKTTGDRFLEESAERLVERAGKGVFIKELEAELLEGKIRLAVHSLKDMPAGAAPGLTIAAFLEREDPRDALVTRSGLKLAELAPGSKVAAGSPRRVSQLRAMRPDLEFVPVRGNIDTRMGKLERGDFDALAVAYAALKRLGLEKSAAQVFSTGEMVPAPGQGVIAVEAAQSDIHVLKVMRRLDHSRTRLCAECERLVLEAFGGGCAAPLGAYASLTEEGLLLKISCASEDGKKRLNLETYLDCSRMKEAAADIARRIKTLL